MTTSSTSFYKTLVVGCGNIAGNFDITRSPSLPPLTHAGAYIKNGNFKIRACIDSDVDRLKRFSEHWNVDQAARSFSELSARSGEFDVISICSPTNWHERHLEDALLLRPKVIFCEKPLTSDIKSSARLVDACHEHGVMLVVNYSRHWDSSVDALIDEIRSGRWGHVRSVITHYNKGILNNGGHMIDLLMRLFGSLDVLATASVTYDFWSDDPTVGALLKSEQEGIAVFMSPANAQDYTYFELEIVCELGVIRMQSGGLTWQFQEVTSSAEFNGYRTLSSQRQTKGQYMDAMANAVENIHQYLRYGAVIRCTGEHALQVQYLCEKIKLMALQNFNLKSKENS